MCFMAAYESQKAGQMELIDKYEALKRINSYGGADATEPENKQSDDLVRAIYADVDSIPSCSRAMERLLIGWIPVEEQLPDESGYYCVTTEDVDTNGRIEQTIWFAHKDDYDMENSEWRELADYERVIAWRKSNPYRK